MRLSLVFLLFANCFYLATFSQPDTLKRKHCHLVSISSKLSDLQVAINEKGQVSSFTGVEDDDEDGGFHHWKFSYDANGMVKSDGSSKGFKVSKYSDGYIIRFSDEERENSIYIDRNHRIYQWQLNGLDADNPEEIWYFYKYDGRGNAISITCKASTKRSTSNFELTATYDISKPSIFNGGIMGMFPEMLWSSFPMTNKNLLTSWEYTQGITVPEQFMALGRERKFSYQFDELGNVKKVTVNAVRINQVYDLKNTECR